MKTYSRLFVYLACFFSFNIFGAEPNISKPKQSPQVMYLQQVPNAPAETTKMLHIGDKILIDGSVYMIQDKKEAGAEVKRLLSGIILPSINYKDSEIIEVLEFLRSKCDDVLLQSESQLHLYFANCLPEKESNRKITIEKKNLSIKQILDFMAVEQGWRISYTKSGIVLSTVSDKNVYE